MKHIIGINPVQTANSKKSGNDYSYQEIAIFYEGADVPWYTGRHFIGGPRRQLPTGKHYLDMNDCMGTYGENLSLEIEPAHLKPVQERPTAVQKAS